MNSGLRGSSARKVPIRTCVVCRGRAEQSQLCRVSWDGEALRLSDGCRGVHRGAYIHPRPECISKLDPERVRRALRLDSAALLREGLGEIKRLLMV